MSLDSGDIAIPTIQDLKGVIIMKRFWGEWIKESDIKKIKKLIKLLGKRGGDNK